jgi:hypothetical protein
MYHDQGQSHLAIYLKYKTTLKLSNSKLKLKLINQKISFTFNVILMLILFQVLYIFSL